MTFIKAEDGNSLIARDMTSDRTYRVRLALIDAPALGAMWAAQSKYALFMMLRNAPDLTVQEYSPGDSETIVAAVVDQAGRNINRTMVERGAARVAAAPTADNELLRAMHATLSAAEQQAKRSGLGLWSAAGRETVNWEYRVN